MLTSVKLKQFELLTIVGMSLGKKTLTVSHQKLQKIKESDVDVVDSNYLRPKFFTDLTLLQILPKKH